MTLFHSEFLENLACISSIVFTLSFFSPPFLYKTMFSSSPYDHSRAAGWHSFTEHLLIVDRPGECQVRHKMLPKVETIINYTVQMRLGNLFKVTVVELEFQPSHSISRAYAMARTYTRHLIWKITVSCIHNGNTESRKYDIWLLWVWMLEFLLFFSHASSKSLSLSLTQLCFIFIFLKWWAIQIS